MNTYVGRSPWLAIGWALLLIGALLSAGNALLFTTSSEFGADYGSPGEFTADFGSNGELSPAKAVQMMKGRMFDIPIVGYSHTLGGMIATLIGPFQLLGSLRRRAPRLHAWLGRVYLLCVGASGLAGLYLAPGSFASNTFGVGFIALAIAWLYTGTKAFATIRAGDVTAHRRWMIRNYALTYAAVTLRLEMPLLIVAGLSPVLALNVVAWTCWVPNWIVVDTWMRRRRPRFAHV
jgi:uncharacterized membrane protein